MKRCPECRRDYLDETLLYCLDDGSVLLDGPASMDAPQTAILPQGITFSESATRAHIDTAEANLQETPEGHSEKQSFSDRHADPGPNRAAWRGSNRTAKPLVLAGIAILLLTSAFFAYRYFNSPATGQINSIAVLPFENRSGSTEADYLSDGLTDSLIFRFSQLPGIKVSPTSSVMRYKGSASSVKEIATALNVDGVLTGRLVQLGDSLSINIQLIDARTEKLVWAEQYDRKMADLLTTQREIATTLTQKMQLRLAGDEKGINKKYTSSSEAYQLYLKGRFHYAKRTTDDIFKAVDSYKKAYELDPNFALAYAATAEAYNSIGKNPSAAPKDSIPLAKAAATRALELDPMLPEAHSALGDSLTIYDWNWVEADRHFKRALELDPNLAYTHVAYGTSFLTAVNRLDEAVAHLERGVELEPLSLINNAITTTPLVYSRQYDKALLQARKAMELAPDFPLAKHWLGVSLIFTGRYDEAIQSCSGPAHDPLSEVLCVVVRGQAYAKSGRRAEAEKEITKLREIGKTNYIRPYYLASIYASLGETDKAFAELEIAFKEKDCYLGRAAVDPFFDPLRDDPRFGDLMKRMGLLQ